MFNKLIITPTVPRKSNPGELISRVHHAMETTEIKIASLGALLEDTPFHKTSAVGRIVKRLPHLSSAVVECNYENKRYSALTTLGEPWEHDVTGTPSPHLSWDHVHEIADGIPRRWSVHHSVFVFDVAGWPGFDAPPEAFRPFLFGRPLCWAGATDYWKPSVIIVSGWTPSGHRDEMHIIIPVLPTPEMNDVELTLHDNLRQFLRVLGTAARAQVETVYTEPEHIAMVQRRNELYDVIKHHCREFNQLLLPVIPAPEWSLERMESLPAGAPEVKARLLEALRGTGFRYDSSRSGQGGYVFSKVVSDGFRFSCELDVSPIARRLSASSVLEGGDFELHLPVPLTDRVSSQSGEPVDPPERLDQLLQNIVRVLSHHEQNLIPELVRQMNPPARWIQNLRNAKKFVP